MTYYVTPVPLTQLELYAEEFEGTEAADIIKLARMGMATERDCDALFRYLVLGELLDAAEAEEIYLAVQEQVQSCTTTNDDTRDTRDTK